MSYDLERCPFCRGEAALNHDYRPIPERWYWGECTVCGIQGRPEYEECDAVLNWNTRAERVCKWEKDRDEWAGEIVFCSECDDEWWLDCDSPEDAGYHYCPNCGGKIECGPPNDTADEHVTITEIGGNDG